MWKVILEALLDSLKTLPILFVVYVLIEFMEHKGEVKFEKTVASSKKFGPLWGAGLGCVPQCGFSAVMADLFSKRMITIGTLFAVFVATSDEAFAILVSQPNYILSVLVLVGFKLVLAIIFGYAIDFVFKKQQKIADNFSHSEHHHSHDTHDEHNHSHSEHNQDEHNHSQSEDNHSHSENNSHSHDKTHNNHSHNEIGGNHQQELTNKDVVEGVKPEQASSSVEMAGKTEKASCSVKTASVVQNKNSTLSKSEQTCKEVQKNENLIETSQEQDVEEKDCSDCSHNHLHHKHEFENEKVEKKSKVFWDIVWQGFLHTMQIFLWILLANIIISVLLEIAGGAEVLETIMGTNSWYQPFVCALIGLIPNCAGSVALVELYIEGVISFASCLGGLCSSAGIGLIILLKNNKNAKQNILIILGLYAIGVIVGLLFNLFLPVKF